MRNCPNLKVETHRIRTGSRSTTQRDGNNGAFQFGHLRVFISDGIGWDHVSVSCENRCPNWGEMCQIKELFFRDDEMAVQFHPAKADHINEHDYCLHLWLSQTVEFPMPPWICV